MLTVFLNTTMSSIMKLLTEFSIKDLITLRERGALTDLRRSLFREVNDLPTSLYSVDVENRLSKSVDDLLRNHAESLEKIAFRDAQFFGYKIVPFLANASVAAAGLSMEDPSIKVLGAAIGISGIGSIKDLVNDWRKKEEEKKLLLWSATAFRFQKSKEA